MRTRQNNWLILLLIYISAAFFLFAILRYWVVFVWNTGLYADDIFVTTRVFFCAPMLIFLGILLIMKFKNFVHRFFGGVFLASGTVWATALIRAVMGEAA